MPKKYKPDELPFGETDHHHYDPEQVNTVSDAIEVFEWLAEENAGSSPPASGAFQDAADLLKREVSE